MFKDFISSWGKLRVPVAAAVLIAALAGGWVAAPEGDAVGAAGATRSSPPAPSDVAEGAAVTGRPHPSAARTAATRQQAPAATRTRTTPSRPQGVEMFKGLGAWIDMFDFGLDPERTMRTLAKNGVRTLYLQTGHSYSRHAVHPRVGRWLVAAHRRGISVVGWYLPSYKRYRWDAQRTAWIARYRYAGHRFDGIGVDIENRSAVPRARIWSIRVTWHFRMVRAMLGDDYPLAAIPPTPLQMQLIPAHWAGFPWKKLNRYADAFLLMSYWSDRSGCPRIRRHCPYEFTRDNVTLTRRLVGDPDATVHIIGGIGDRIQGTQLWSFARGALDAGANGASIYDVATTRSSWWSILRNLRDLD